MSAEELTLAADLLHVLRVLGTACVGLWACEVVIEWLRYRMERRQHEQL